MAKDRPAPDIHQTELSRDMSEFDITMIGVGAMIGAGIFVLTGIAAGTAGPALMLAFALNGVLTLFTAMTYAEMGSAIPEAGGGYLWVKDALGKENGFLAGWMSWFSHGVAGALYAIGFGAFANHLVEQLFHFELPHWTLLGLGFGGEKIIGVAIALVFVYINFRGASETGLAGNIVTLAKVTVIGIFLLFGAGVILGQMGVAIGRFDPFFPMGYDNVFMAMGLTFIAFEGYEIIVQAGEEVENPRRTIPRAVFKSLMIVVPIYVLVAIIAIGAINPPGAQATYQFLGEHGELGIIEAANNFILPELAPLGAVVLLAGGLLSTISALNATTYSSTRVAFAMGRDKVLPESLAKVHDRTRTPHIALGFTGVLIIFMVVFVPIESVAAAADIMFILLFLQVNYTVIRMRNEFGDRLEYGYKIPWFPLIPILGIGSLIVLGAFLFRLDPWAWYGAIAWLGVGLVIFFAYSRGRVREAEKPVITHERKIGPRGRRRILVPIADPSHIPTEMTIAGALARRADAEILAVHAVLISPQLPLSEGENYAHEAEPVLDEIREFSDEHLPDITVNTVAAVGHQPSQVINNVAEREEVDYTLIGWQGELRESLIRGSVAQAVVTWCPSDVAVIRDRGLPDRIDEIMVSVAPGFHGAKAVRTAAELAEGFDADVRLVTVKTPQTEETAEELSAFLEDVRSALAEEGYDVSRVRPDVVEGESAVDTIVYEARDSDLLVIGATRDWAVRRRLLGSKPDQIADRTEVTTVMVKGRETRVESWWHRIVGALR